MLFVFLCCFWMPVKESVLYECIQPRFMCKIVIRIKCVTVRLLLRRLLSCVLWLQQRGSDDLERLLSFVLVFMGSQEYMRNPHLRAGMAEALETLLPPRSTPNRPSTSLLSTQWAMVFYTPKMTISQEIDSKIISVFSAKKQNTCVTAWPQYWRLCEQCFLYLQKMMKTWGINLTFLSVVVKNIRYM